MDAWLDLAPASGERQRAAGQLVQGLEGAAALLAYHQHGGVTEEPLAGQDGAFLKVTDNVYVTIRSLSLAPADSATANRTLEVSFPAETSLLATKWMNSDQRYTLHLQTALGDQPTTINGAGQVVATDVKYNDNEQPTSNLAPGKWLR